MSGDDDNAYSVLVEKSAIRVEHATSRHELISGGHVTARSKRCVCVGGAAVARAQQCKNVRVTEDDQTRQVLTVPTCSVTRIRAQVSLSELCDAVQALQGRCDYLDSFGIQLRGAPPLLPESCALLINKIYLVALHNRVVVDEVPMWACELQSVPSHCALADLPAHARFDPWKAALILDPSTLLRFLSIAKTHDASEVCISCARACPCCHEYGDVATLSTRNGECWVCAETWIARRPVVAY